ncbi:DUF2157 domain-containing protein [Piscinibacter sp.]|uniref:DUF2157 domain-containing protein n=1 Tax=Piscinibacter sp. TaxID=1903157 RepID=UPI0035AF1348
MDLRLALHELEAAHGLDDGASRRLQALAGLGDEPRALKRWLPLGLAVLAAALLGLGLIFWIAANWETLGRFGRFAVLQGAIVAMGIGALARPAWRAPLALVVLLATGALFAYFGQTYQTGADPWQLFALWAALALPLALAVRSDLLWAPWTLVAFVAIALWIHAHTGHRWRVEPDDLAVHLLGWAAAGAIVLAMSALARRFTGAGVWALRTAVTLAVVVIASTALAGLFSRSVATHYGFGLLVLAALAAAFVPRRSFDVFALSAVALGLNTLAVAGLGRLLFENAHGDPIGRLFLLGALAAGMLAASVNGVLRLARAHAAAEGATA